MGNNLKFTNNSFIKCVSATSSISANTRYDILPSTSIKKRIYGISLTTNENAIKTIKLYLNDGSAVYQVFVFSLPAGSGTNGTAAALDVFASSLPQSIFQKMRDNNGMAYFNLPGNWSIQIEFNTAIGVGESINSFVFGEEFYP